MGDYSQWVGSVYLNTYINMIIIIHQKIQKVKKMKYHFTFICFFSLVCNWYFWIILVWIWYTIRLSREIFFSILVYSNSNMLSHGVTKALFLEQIHSILHIKKLSFFQFQDQDWFWNFPHYHHKDKWNEIVIDQLKKS